MILLVASAIVMASCGMMQSTPSSANSSSSQAASTATTQTKTTTPTAQTGTLTSSNAAINSGQSAGTALLALYNQYKADGNKYDYKNLNNVINCLQLVSACEGFKENKTNKVYYKDFGKGLLVSAVGLVTESNVNTVTNQLAEMVTSNEQINSAATNMADKLNTAAQTASTVSSILSMFAK